MKTLVNVFHPKLAQSTVNRLWAQRLQGLPDVTVRRVYELYPNGKIDVPPSKPRCWRTTAWCSSTRFSGIPCRP